MSAIATHRLDVFGAELCLCTTKKQWRKLREVVPPLGKVGNSAGYCQLAFRPGDYCVAIYIDQKFHEDSPARLANTVAHESAHATQFILEHVGENKTHETHAYLTGWITGWIWANLHDEGT